MWKIKNFNNSFDILKKYITGGFELKSLNCSTHNIPDYMHDICGNLLYQQRHFEYLINLQLLQTNKFNNSDEFFYKENDDYFVIDITKLQNNENHIKTQFDVICLENIDFAIDSDNNHVVTLGLRATIYNKDAGRLVFLNKQEPVILYTNNTYENVEVNYEDDDYDYNEDFLSSDLL